MKKNEKNKKMIRARIDNDNYEALKKILKHNNTTIQKMINDSVIDYILNNISTLNNK